MLKRNIDRVSKIAEAGVETGKFLQSCFDWESKARSLSAFIVSLFNELSVSVNDVNQCLLVPFSAFQCPSVPICAHPRPSVPIRAHPCHPCPSVSIRVYPSPSVPIRAHPCPSVPIRAHPCPSVPIRAHPCPSVPIRAHPCASVIMNVIHVYPVTFIFPVFQIFLIIVWNFELYMLPVTLLIVFLKNLLVVHIAGNLMKDKEEDVCMHLSTSFWTYIHVGWYNHNIYLKSNVQ